MNFTNSSSPDDAQNVRWQGSMDGPDCIEHLATLFAYKQPEVTMRVLRDASNEELVRGVAALANMRQTYMPAMMEALLEALVSRGIEVRSLGIGISSETPQPDSNPEAN
jgi:hypothetical protein